MLTFLGNASFNQVFYRFMTLQPNQTLGLEAE